MFAASPGTAVLLANCSGKVQSCNHGADTVLRCYHSCSCTCRTCEEAWKLQPGGHGAAWQVRVLIAAYDALLASSKPCGAVQAVGFLTLDARAGWCFGGSGLRRSRSDDPRQQQRRP